MYYAHYELSLAYDSYWDYMYHNYTTENKCESKLKNNEIDFSINPSFIKIWTDRADKKWWNPIRDLFVWISHYKNFG